MLLQKTEYQPSNVKRHSSIYALDNDNTIEIHSLFTIQPSKDTKGDDEEVNTFESQLERIKNAFASWRFEKGCEKSTVFLRFFISDAANQAHLIKSKDFSDCAISIVQQPPLFPNTKVVLWCYDIIGQTCLSKEPFYTVQHNRYTHYWMCNQSLAKDNSKEQTHQLLESYEEALQKEQLNFANDCIRTWFFVQNIDVNYHGVVVGRRENFEQIGLTSKTHYIASTGIEGRSANPAAQVLFDAYAIKGLQPNQQQYLYAKENLNPTYEYGVTFERGVKVMYGDRSHLYISGTASINNKGEVVHVGNIRKQTQRMMENVKALLKEGGATPDDVTIAIVYLRDYADFETVKRLFAESEFQHTPKVFVLAPVCRPTWLIEMECIAISQIVNKYFDNF